MMAPVHSKESASKLGSMYFLKFLKNILILNLIHIIGSGVKGGHFLLKSGGVSSGKRLWFLIFALKMAFKNLKSKKSPKYFQRVDSACFFGM